jgi:hypothetical protein
LRQRFKKITIRRAGRNSKAGRNSNAERKYSFDRRYGSGRNDRYRN